MARMPRDYSICVVCSGNICRSPVGEVVLREALERDGLAASTSVCSAGTGAWHLGESADRRAVEVARAHGLDLSDHRAQMFEPAHLAEVDLVLALDRGHLRALQALATDEAGRAKVRLLRSFDPAAVAEQDLDVPDPYYGDLADFEIAFDQVSAAVPGILAHVRAALTVP